MYTTVHGAPEVSVPIFSGPRADRKIFRDEGYANRMFYNLGSDSNVHGDRGVKPFEVCAGTSNPRFGGDS